MILQPLDKQTHPSRQIHVEMPTMHLGTIHKPKQLEVVLICRTRAHICPLPTPPSPYTRGPNPMGEPPVHVTHTGPLNMHSLPHEYS